MEKATGNKISIDIYYSQALTRGPDAWEAVKTGVADIALCSHNYWSGLTPLTEVINLPGLPFRTAEKGSEILWKIYRKYPEIQNEFSDVKVLVLYTSNPYVLMTRNARLNGLNDLKELRISVTDQLQAAQIRSLGGIPVEIPLPDNYLALQKGIIDGMGAPWLLIHRFKLYEVVNYFTEVPLPAEFFSLIINKHVWEGMSSTSKKAILSVSGLNGSKRWGAKTFDSVKTNMAGRGNRKGLRVTVNSLAETERKKWIDKASKPFWDQWIKKMEANGHTNARHILNSILGMK